MLLSTVHLGTAKCTYVIALHLVALASLSIIVRRRTATDFISGAPTAVCKYTHTCIHTQYTHCLRP